jgi:hypothetical protein
MAERADTVRKTVLHVLRPPTRVLTALLGAFCWCALPAHSDPLANDYPTSARVEYVQDCIGRHGGKLEALYKCSCVIDRLAQKLTYDEYVEDSTFAHYSTLPGEGGGIFRDPDTAKQKAKLYRTLEAESFKACGLGPAIR